MIFPALLLLSFINQSAALKTAGILTIESGTVQLTRGETTRAAKVRERILESDSLTVSTPGNALVTLQSTREVWRLEGGAKVSIGAAKIVSRSGAKPTFVTKLSEVKKDPSSKRTIGLSGILRGGARGIEPIGAIRSGPVKLSWSSDAWVASAKIEIYSMDGVLVWSHEGGDPAKTTIEVPQSALKHGEWYQVQVLLTGQKGADGLMRRERRQTEIKVLSSTEKSELESAEGAIKIAFKDDTFTLGDSLGELYATFALANELKKSIAIGFKDKVEGPEAYFRLGDLFLLSGFQPEAMVAYTRAWDLGNRDPELKEAIKLLSGGGEPQK